MRKLSGSIAQPDGSLRAGTVAFESAIEEVAVTGGGADYILPGLLDLQINGAFGIDVMSAAAADLVRLADRLAREGITSFLPTAITAPLNHLQRVERAVAEARAREQALATGAAIVGLHLEGPFISKARLGVHPEASACEPRGEPLEASLAMPGLRLITLAPELPGAIEAITRLRRRAVAVALGHSDATIAQARAALAAGASMFTHLFNAMRPLHQREPGIIGAALADSAACAAVIPDGVHVHPEILRLVYRLRAARGIALTSDSVAEAKTGVEQRAARTPDGRLAGSLISLLDGVRLMVQEVGISLGEAALMAAANPARILGLSDRGRLIPGARADILVLDKQLRLKAVFISGRELT